jgi:hypothetical protein
MLATGVRGAINGRPLASFLGAALPCQRGTIKKTLICTHNYSTIPKHKSQSYSNHPSQTQIQLIRASSSFSALPPDEEQAEKERVGSLTQYQKEMELRQLDSELARLQTLRAINTGELYTLRGKFKMLSRDYGMGFLAWYWTVWFATAGMSYVAIEVGGVDPLMVAAKVETFLGWETDAIAGKLDPTLGQIGLVIAVNECLEPLRLPLVVMTTKPVVNFFSRTS